MNTGSRYQVSIEADTAVPIIRITRDFDATPRQLMRAHTDPELFARWVGPKGMETMILDWDATTGGRWRYVAAQLGQDDVEAFVALLGLLAVPLDPSRHQVEDLRLQMTRPPLRVATLAHQSGIAEHLDVLGHRLDGDVVRLGQVPDGGITNGEPSHHVAPCRVGESRERSRQLIVPLRRRAIQPSH